MVPSPAGSLDDSRTCMAATTQSTATGPVPFKDLAGAVPVGLPTNDDDPKRMHVLICYQGTWVLDQHLPGIVSIQRSFVPRRGDVVLTSPPKCGTTWLKALAFATMARGAYPPARADEHPLSRLNPHDCVPFMEMLFAADPEQAKSKMDALPSPRLMATHMHHSILPSSIKDSADCKIIYICRDPKDMVVSLWHFARRAQPELSFPYMFEDFCDGTSAAGPIWDHVLGYWNASKEKPEKVLFLRYDEMLRDPAGNVRKLAQFVGQPFSPAEEEAGVAMDIVRLCSFDTLRNLVVNKAAAGSSSSPSPSSSPFANDSYFRKGEDGDWVNHVTPDMARRLDAVVEEKLRGSGLSFA
ncbi:unnamed protein product [Urochloa decumbens]|uniref:Sulfotransferase n=1 Tax=Urochloa decumbens TaxID=240449 RepID=A0ABC9BKL2_9POAL